MDWLLTPVSTSYASSDNAVEDALYVYPPLIPLQLGDIPLANRPTTEY
jgi:hypothetical protein